MVDCEAGKGRRGGVEVPQWVHGEVQGEVYEGVGIEGWKDVRGEG